MKGLSLNHPRKSAFRLEGAVGIVVLSLACVACAPDPGAASLGDADRSWARALRAARSADWPYAKIAPLRTLVEQMQHRAGQNRKTECKIGHERQSAGNLLTGILQKT